MRSRTSCAAIMLSVSRSNIRTTVEWLFCEVEVIVSIPASVFTASSMTVVISDSTVSGLAPAQGVRMATTGKSTLGYWSMGRLR